MSNAMPNPNQTTRRSRVFPPKFTLTIEECPTLGWIITTDAHPGFIQTILPEEGLPEGLRQFPAILRECLVAKMDLEREKAGG